MATRDLLDPRTLLLVALGCSGCEQHHDRDWEDLADPGSCELEVVGEAMPPSAELRHSLSPTTDLRIACGGPSEVYGTSVGIGADGVYVMRDAPYSCASRGSLYRLDDLDRPEHTTVTELEWSTELPCWANLQGDDDGIVSLFWQSYDPALWRTTLPNEDWRAEPLGLDAGEAERVEIAGSQPHLWLWHDEELVHATSGPDGTWFEQPSLSVEGVMTLAIGLDGSGNQLAYGLDDAWELWTFDGASTQHAGPSPTSEIMPVPTAHPTDPTHEHAAVLVDWSHVEFVWPKRGVGTTVIPPSPTYANDPDAPCLWPTNVVAARTADGRVWLAWIVNAHPKNCEASAVTQAGSLRLVEIDPARPQPLEVMRVELDTANLDTYTAYEGLFADVTEVQLYYGELSLAAFGQQLVLVVADGPEHARMRVLSVDTSR